MLGSDWCSTLPRVTSDRLFMRSGEPHPDGLFSTVIFGDNMKDRSERFASIHFNTQLFHPEVWRLLRKVFRDKIKAILNLIPYTITQEGDIKLLDEKDLENTDNYYIGLSALIDRIFEVKIPENTYGNKLKTIIDKYPDKVRISCIDVIPPIYREVKDEVNLDPLNQAYVNLIKYSNNIVTLAKDYKDEIYNKYINLMQLQIQKIYEYIESKVGKKFGAVRQYLLGKRIDFTGRAVIIPGPDLDLDELGIPIRMAVKLFEPWVIRDLLRQGYALDQALELVNKISKGFIKSGKEYEDVKHTLEVITKDRVVLAKRDPALHRLSWQAYKIKLTEDDVISVNPLHTTGHNADFDGDSVLSDVNIVIDINGNKQELNVHISELEELEVDV
jgi:DNA-directed RNA polymerase beta' subunit